MPALSRFGLRYTGKSGIVALMEDLGSALRTNPDMIMMGGGTPARIPAVEQVFRRHLQEICADPERAFALLPLPPGETAHRYVMSAAGGTLRESRIKFLEAIGVQVNHMDLDVSLDEFDAMVSAIIAAAAKTVE